MKIIDHPSSFREGTRVFCLAGRNKDGCEPRRVVRVTHDPEAHERVMADLVAISRPGERIYGCVSARDLTKATKHFKHQMIDEDEAEFFRRLNARWESALMQPSSRAEKLWLWDCDKPSDEYGVRNSLPPGEGLEVYAYPTKNGSHIITKPFDMRRVPPEIARIRDDNGMMLWGYCLSTDRDDKGSEGQ